MPKRRMRADFWLVMSMLAGAALFLPEVMPTIAAPPQSRAAGRPAQSANQPARPAPGEVDVERSRVYVFVGKAGFGHEHAIEGRLQSGSLRLKQRPAGRIDFDMTSFDADTPQARAYLRMNGETAESTRQKVNANMHSASVLDVGRYPTATFAVDSAEHVKNGRSASYRLKGHFVLHGVKREVLINATPTMENGMLHLRGQFDILQTDFGIKPFKAALGAVGVSDRLTIYGDLWIQPDEAP